MHAITQVKQCTQQMQNKQLADLDKNCPRTVATKRKLRDYPMTIPPWIGRFLKKRRRSQFQPVPVSAIKTIFFFHLLRLRKSSLPTSTKGKQRAAFIADAGEAAFPLES